MWEKVAPLHPLLPFLLFSLHVGGWHSISRIPRHAEHAAVFCLSPFSSLAGGWSNSTFPVCWQALWREFSSKHPQNVVFPLGTAEHRKLVLP